MNKNINMNLVKSCIAVIILIMCISMGFCILGANNAKESALSHAGFSSADVSNIRWDFDFEDFYATYDIEWYYNNMEYDYKINALNGEILKFEVE